jgi:hypothetical protein
MRGKTLREAFADNTRTQTLRLYHITGERIARLPIEEAIEKYGDWEYCNGYSESFTEVSVWILDTAK